MMPGDHGIQQAWGEVKNDKCVYLLQNNAIETGSCSYFSNGLQIYLSAVHIENATDYSLSFCIYSAPFPQWCVFYIFVWVTEHQEPWQTSYISSLVWFQEEVDTYICTYVFWMRLKQNLVYICEFEKRKCFPPLAWHMLCIRSSDMLFTGISSPFSNLLLCASKLQGFERRVLVVQQVLEKNASANTGAFIHVPFFIRFLVMPRTPGIA